MTRANSKYMEGAVEELLKTGPKTSQELRTAMKLPPQSQNQALDRALQRMKGTNKVALINGQWALGPVKVCSGCGGKGWV